MAQDAVFVEARNLGEPGIDLGEHRALALLALGRRHRKAWIEARLEQRRDSRREAGMLDEGRPHIVLGIGHADLAQIARQGAQQRHLTPRQSGDEHQRIVAVVFGVVAHDGGEAVVEPPLGRFEIDRAIADEFEQHVVQPELPLVRSAGLGVIGALVDDPETHVLEHGYALRQRQRTAVAPQLETGRAGIVAAGAALEIDAERSIGGHRLERRDVLHRGRGRKGIAIGRRKRAAVAGEETACNDRIVGSGQRLEQEIRPRLHDA